MGCSKSKPSQVEYPQKNVKFDIFIFLFIIYQSLKIIRIIFLIIFSIKKASN